MNKIRFACGCLLTVGCAAFGAPAQTADQPVVTFLATDPAPDAQLARNERFYVRFTVKSATPSAVMINAYAQGNPVFADMGSSTVNQLPAGETTAVAHFFYWGMMTRHIDEIRLTVGAPDAPGTGREFTLPVHLTLTPNDAAAAHAYAPWVLEWQHSPVPQPSAMSSAANSAVARQPLVWLGVVLAAALAIGGWLARQRRSSRRDAER